ncbi:Ig-like domain-containing protein [Bradyrhizobium sp. USDA 10063]
MKVRRALWHGLLGGRGQWHRHNSGSDRVLRHGAGADPVPPVIGSASTWGFPATGYFDVSPGGTCLFSLNINGEILSATITQAPSNGRVSMVNVSTYTYTANPGFTGTDTFVIRATGKDIDGPAGTSVITMNATVR